MLFSVPVAMIEGKEILYNEVLSRMVFDAIYLEIAT